MSRSNKRRITAILISSAGVLVLLAICLAWVQSSSGPVTPDFPPDSPDPTQINVSLTPQPPMEIPRAPLAPPDPKPKPEPKVDVVFVLDTTGSMAGLIAGAKRKIWSIANQILAGQPKPHVRIGLIGYRDLDDDYVTRRYNLTEEIDDVYANLRRFSANGGGDTPEHVNRALDEAINKMQWRKGQHVLRQIFLVGDAPPHEGREGLSSSALAREATRKGIVINTVRCGTMGATERSWRRIALAAGGKFASIRQDGAMVARATPMDERLKTLNVALTDTLLPTGSFHAKSAARRRARYNKDMDAFAQAESAKYRARSGRLDGTDLLTKMKKGKRLSDFSEAELPAPVAAMPRPAQRAYVAKVARRRAKLKREITDLSKKRDAYLKARGKRGPKSFDDTLGDALEAQGASAGIAY